MDQYLQPDYWHAKAAAIFQWFEREIFIDQSLINLIAIFAGIAIAWLIARSLKPKLTAIIVARNLAQTPLGRLLQALEQALTYVIAVVLLWLAMAVFQRFGLKVYLLNLFESLLTAWVVIHLITSIVRQAHWARFIAFTAWTVAALHIFSLLDPALALLDSLAITIGDTRLSILIIIKAVILLSFLMWLAISVSNLFGKRISTIEGMAPSIQVLLSKTIAITLTILAVLIAVRIAIWDSFEANGIKIPFPQRMVHMVAQPAENKIEKI